ncbi:putative acyl-activating enzyme chloroplastic [Micractinium conductrix]|uniref:Acyl-activating enzyme chloroplastic n=1 Tax=Micractinium conductrix TaxID=554055 RepID=A0A2P6V3Z8_9CHLO|nr:putative acyl-activating enzyme chloroplastic [Micractinium conductrix]|eukprot:PSC68813.1 putative acyl-activating enzyme chloroplastic [Micractinium conductrix]
MLSAAARPCAEAHCAAQVGRGSRRGLGSPLALPTRSSRCSRARSSAPRVSSQLQLRTSPAPAPEHRPREPQAAPAPAALPGGLQTLPQLWDGLAARHGDAVAVVDPHHLPAEQHSFAQLAAAIKQLAAGLQALGLSKGDRVALFSENGGRWLIADQAIMTCGAADAVRGTSSSLEELQYILQHSGSSGLVVQDAATLDKLLPALTDAAAQPLRFIVQLWGEPSAAAAAALGSQLHTFEGVLALGEGRQLAPAEGLAASDLATLVYTSGTTGHPKGVMLTHANLLYQVNNLSHFLAVSPGERSLSLLPPWHIYERACGYYIFSRGACQVYSNIRKFKDDLSVFPPDYFVCVPLVLDTLHGRVLQTLKKASAVRRALATGLLAAAGAHMRARRVVEGTSLDWATVPRPLAALAEAWLAARLLAPLNWLFQRLVAAKVRTALGIRGCVVSGGGSLSPHLDVFYESIGLPVLNGWGLTESSPVLACRRNLPNQNVRGSVGQTTPGTQLRFVDPESLQDVPDGQQGLILAKGPGVMAGYFGDEGATAKAFRAGDGWLDTGDLGWRAPAGVAGSRMGGTVVLTGRAKDTIVLSSGENVEPQPIEDALCCSPYIKFAVLTGSGHRALGALIVPDSEALEEAAKQRGLEALPAADVESLIKGEVRGLLAGRIRWEHVAAFEILSEPFSVEDGTLTRTMKPRRNEIFAKYSAEVARLEAHLR